jgi:ketosteroid isomerase-like protein
VADPTGLETVMEHYHQGLHELVNGNCDSLKPMWSEKEDVSLGNPFGPFVTGRQHVISTMERATSHYKDGEVVAFEEVAKHQTPDLAFVVEVERYKAKIGGGHDVVPVNLRVTTIFRPEDGSWKILHRHADPITTPQTVESVIGT